MYAHVCYLHEWYVRGCTSGGVYVPCIYRHARRVTVGDSGLFLLYLCYVFRSQINILSKPPMEKTVNSQLVIVLISQLTFSRQKKIILLMQLLQRVGSQREWAKQKQNHLFAKWAKQKQNHSFWRVSQTEKESLSWTASQTETESLSWTASQTETESLIWRASQTESFIRFNFVSLEHTVRAGRLVTSYGMMGNASSMTSYDIN